MSSRPARASIPHPSIAAPDGAQLAALHEAARARLLALIADLSDEQLRVPRLEIVNPPLWELGHVAWFHERWNLRHLAGRRPLRSGCDELFDSAAVDHGTRWDLKLPAREQVLAYLKEVSEATCERLLERSARGEPLTDAERYFAQLTLLHEEMHVEALAYTRQTLALPAPAAPAAAGAATDAASGAGEVAGAGAERAVAPDGAGGTSAAAAIVAGDVEISGGSFLVGAAPTKTFVFDNEKWAHPVVVKPFRIARAATTNGDFAEFVEAGGYERRELWSEAGWRWRVEAGARHPVYWRREPGGRWQRRRFDRFLPLDERQPVLHVCWFEADAFCRFRGRRLPTEAEWELAASGEPDGRGGLAAARRLFPWGGESPAGAARARLGAPFGDVVAADAFAAGDSAFGCRQMIGNVWEWTASDFRPYPGFVPDPYAEYSQPWFGDHKVLRGGCFVTQPHLIRNTWRNFYTPDRRDVWAGFRTCA